MKPLHALMACFLLSPLALWAVAHGYVSDSPNLKLYDHEVFSMGVISLPLAFRVIQHLVRRRRKQGPSTNTLWGSNILPYAPLCAVALLTLSPLPWALSASGEAIVMVLALAAFVLLTLDAFPSPVEPGQFGPRWVLSSLTALPSKLWRATPILGNISREVDRDPERGMAYVAVNSLMLTILIVWVSGLEAAILMATVAAPIALLRVTLLTSGKFRG